MYEELAAIVKVEQTLNSLDPVSYTHLDVYKRQDQFTTNNLKSPDGI